MSHLIIADDEPHMLLLLEMTLRKGGHTWTACRDGHEVLASVRKASPACIIMDVIMPSLDGLAALAALKADPATTGIPVIMLTARGHSLPREQAETSGAAAFLTKPYSPTELLGHINRLVAERT